MGNCCQPESYDMPKKNYYPTSGLTSVTRRGRLAISDKSVVRPKKPHVCLYKTVSNKRNNVPLNLQLKSQPQGMAQEPTSPQVPVAISIPADYLRKAVQLRRDSTHSKAHHHHQKRESGLSRTGKIEVKDMQDMLRALEMQLGSDEELMQGRSTMSLSELKTTSTSSSSR